MSDQGNPLSLAAWSLHRTFESGEIDQLGMVQLAGKLGFAGFEMVNTFFPVPTYAYLQELRFVGDGAGVKLVLIMCDEEGDLAADDRTERLQAARNHRRWVDVAATLGCQAIRVNVGVEYESHQPTLDHAAESLAALLEYSAGEVKVLIENHGGVSSDPTWIVALMERVGDPNLGTLPDFGNFGPFDRYDGVEALVPFAGGVSAKCYDFDDRGEETTIDFARMVDIALAAGYRGFIGVEYEGERLPEVEGIAAAKRLLERIEARTA
jgi:sugar phosphate isomerase/epimerase